MNAAELKGRLYELIAQVNDKELLAKMYAVISQLIDQNEEHKYHAKRKPDTPSKYEELIARSQQQIDDGEYVTLEELEQESKTWL